SLSRGGASRVGVPSLGRVPRAWDAAGVGRAWWDRVRRRVSGAQGSGLSGWRRSCSRVVSRRRGGAAVRELGLPRTALVAVVARGNETSPPRGSTVIKPGERLFVLAPGRCDPRSKTSSHVGAPASNPLRESLR